MIGQLNVYRWLVGLTDPVASGGTFPAGMRNPGYPQYVPSTTTTRTTLATTKVTTNNTVTSNTTALMATAINVIIDTTLPFPLTP